jgi:uncharacterized membrane protein
VRTIAKIFAGPGLVLAGLNHFVMPKSYRAIMPDYLPAHNELVAASGVAEILSGAAAIHPRTRKLGGAMGIATLVAVFPANLHMALHPERYRKISPAALYGRLPIQALMIYWVWLATFSED